MHTSSPKIVFHKVFTAHCIQDAGLLHTGPIMASIVEAIGILSRSLIRMG